MAITTKWPGLIVVGESVTEEQALEINIRTGLGSLSSNERDYERAIWSHILQEPPEDPSRTWRPYSWEQKQKACDMLNCVPLSYLPNDWILSAWIGGPKGWCRPDGRIFCNNYNIGKWPSDEDVYEDLRAIAAAFPYLKMDVQVLDDEIGAESLRVPVSEWHVEDGLVMDRSPGVIFAEPDDMDIVAAFTRSRKPGGEVGIPPAKVFAAIDRLLGRDPLPPPAVKWR